jgi:hypothetical protein
MPLLECRHYHVAVTVSPTNGEYKLWNLHRDIPWEHWVGYEKRYADFDSNDLMVGDLPDTCLQNKLHAKQNKKLAKELTTHARDRDATNAGEEKEGERSESED